MIKLLTFMGAASVPYPLEGAAPLYTLYSMCYGWEMSTTAKCLNLPSSSSWAVVSA